MSDMNVQIDLRVAELLSSRLCHDLVGPVGAVNNGLELLEDDMDDMGPEAMKLASESGARAARALQYFRFAYGMAGSRLGGQLTELRELAANFFAEDKFKLIWPDHDIPAETPDDTGKLLLNLLLLGSEALPLGGEMTVGIGVGEGRLNVALSASGDRAALRDETRPALVSNTKPEDLTPRNVHAFFTCRVAERLGGDLAVDETTPGTVRFTVSLPA